MSCERVASRGRTLVVLAVASLGGCGQNRESPAPLALRSMEGPDQRAIAPVPRARIATAEGALASRAKIGAPYRVGSTWYVPREDSTYDRTGQGSWYGVDFHGKPTANGEIYNMHALTAAHPTLPLPSYVTVTNTANNRTILVRVNDRGPYVVGRIIDLSQAAADALGYGQMGVAHLRVRYVGRAPLDGNNERERHYLASQPWASSLQVAQRSAPVPRTRDESWTSHWGLGWFSR